MASNQNENAAPTAEPSSASTNPEVTKWSIRQRIWDYIEKNDLANYPRPVNHRIPNFKGAEEAGDKVATLDVFKNARTIKVNPDKPQMQVRFLTMEANKTLLVPTPRLRTGLFNKLEPPADCGKDMLRTCSTAQGVKEYSKSISLDDKVTVDLVVLGSVAVSEKGFRIGKGEGFADLEFAMMMSMGAVSESTIVVTTVHDCQVTDIPEHLIESHDVTVDFIVTPTRIIECPYRPKPAGIIWSKLDKNKIQQVPILKKLRAMESEKGNDTRIRNDIDPDYKPPEQEYVRDGRPPRQRRPRQRFMRNRNKNSESGAEKDAREEGGDDANKGEYSPDSKPRQRRRRPRNNRRNRDSEASQGDHEESDVKSDARRESGDQGDSSQAGKPRPRRRRPNRRRNKDSEHSATGDDVEDKGDSTDPESRGQPKPMRRRRPQRNSRYNDKENQGELAEQGDGEGRPPRRRLSKLPSLYVGGIPRSVRVSEFKAKVRGQEVNPISVIWQGGMGRSYLLFDNTDEIDKAMEALKGLNINGKDLRIEVSNKTNRLRSNNNNSTNNEKDMEKEKVEAQMNGEAIEA